MRKLITILACTAVLMSSLGCGTIMYPERKGQSLGKIDPAVAILDGLGLLLFLVPGVIAFAVDFSNGTIYLPAGNGSAGLETDVDHMTAVYVGRENLTQKRIRHVVQANTGQKIGPDGNIEIYAVLPDGQRQHLTRQNVDRMIERRSGDGR